MPLKDLEEEVSMLKWGEEVPLKNAPEAVTELQKLREALVVLANSAIEKVRLSRRYVNDLVKVQEEERARISREIHDGPLQDLTALIQRLRLLSIDMDSPEEREKQLEEAEKVVAEMKETVESFKEKAANVTEKKSVLFEIDPTPFVAGSNTFLQEILDMINGENVVGDMEGWPQVDQELLIERNPDVIITTYGDYIDGAVDQVKARDGWQDVNAVKNNEVYDINSDLVTVPGPRLVEGVEEVAKAVYPEIFNE